MSSPRAVSRATFWLGGLAAVALAPALVAAALGLLARRGGFGDPLTGADTRLFVAAGFAGLPAFVTGGGVARLIAYRRHEAQADARFWRDLALGAGAMGIAGIALAVLTAVPLGNLPDEPRRWAPLILVGFAIGVPTGLAIAALTSIRQARRDARVERDADTDLVLEAAPEPVPPRQPTPVFVEPTPPPRVVPTPARPTRDWSKPLDDRALDQALGDALDEAKTRQRPLPTGPVVVPPRPPRQKKRRKGR